MTEEITCELCGEEELPTGTCIKCAVKSEARHTAKIESLGARTQHLEDAIRTHLYSHTGLKDLVSLEKALKNVS